MPIRSSTAELCFLLLLTSVGAAHAQSQTVWHPTMSVPVGNTATIHYGSSQTRTTPGTSATHQSASSWGNPPSVWSRQSSLSPASSNQTPNQPPARHQYPPQQQYAGSVQSGPQQLPPDQFRQPAVPPGLQWPQAFAARDQQQPYGPGIAGSTPQQFGFQNQTASAGVIRNQNPFPGQQPSPTDATRLQHAGADRDHHRLDHQQPDRPAPPDPREQAFWNSLYGRNLSTFNQSRSNYSFAAQNRFNQSPAGLTRSGVQHTGFTNWSNSTHNVSNMNQNRSNYSLHNVTTPPAGLWR